MNSKIQEIAKRISVVTLEQGLWSPIVTNRDESAKVNAAHHTKDAAKVLVTLTNSPSLVALGELKRKVYAEHTAMTRPSITKGMRILRTGFHLKHSEMIRIRREEMLALVDQFVPEYIAEKASAPARLNGLFNAADWPSPSEVRARFRCDVRYLPCPSDGAWSEWLEETVLASEAELVEQFGGALRHLVATCKADGRLYQSVFSNLKELIDLVPATNITDLPLITKVAAEAKELGEIDARTVRDDQVARRAAAAKAERLLGLFGTNQ